MNKFVNTFLLFLYLPVLLFTVFVGFDLPITMLHVSGQNIPNKEYVFLGIGLLVLLVNIRRTIRRWMGVAIVSKQQKFLWSTPIASSRKKRVATYTLLEGFVFLIAGVALYEITPFAWAPAIAYSYCFVDNVLFLLLTRNKHRAALSSKALIVVDREVTLLYFTGLRKISIHQQSVFFDYIQGLQLDFPTDCIGEEKQEDFFNALEGVINQDKVFVTRKH